MEERGKDKHCSITASNLSHILVLFPFLSSLAPYSLLTIHNTTTAAITSTTTTILLLQSLLLLCSTAMATLYLHHMYGSCAAAVALCWTRLLVKQDPRRCRCLPPFPDPLSLLLLLLRTCCRVPFPTFCVLCDTGCQFAWSLQPAESFSWCNNDTKH